MKIVFIQKLIDFLRGKGRERERERERISNLSDIIRVRLKYRNAVKSLGDIPDYKIIFKFDDLINCNEKVMKLDKFIKKENLKVCWGIIGKSMENAKTDYIEFIKNNNGKNYAFFNHGYLHLGGPEYEFQNKNVEAQYKSIKRTQDIVLNKTGITLNSFGAPCNHIDENTKIALEKIPEIKYWFYGVDSSNICNLKRHSNMENGVGKPDFLYFIDNLKILDKNVKVLTLQGHPYMWNINQNFNFRLIVKFLKKAGCEFIFPSESEKNNGQEEL